MALNLDLKNDSGMDLSLPSNNTSRSGTPLGNQLRKTTCNRHRHKEVCHHHRKYQVYDQRSEVKWNNGRKRSTLPGRQLPKSSSLQRATPNCGPKLQTLASSLIYHHLDSIVSSSITILTAPHPSINQEAPLQPATTARRLRHPLPTHRHHP
ncbi:hypothetical protein TNIN_102691 [Trichonephila inaurata madagascariensis]|uniref:Uncharacterized protein n=1 Tax=Trichonephila inaurata madagascariensis TaxID=2747483 RepID=A0A8X6Y954_9ARAC|nr:hypothetical protein TNIN_102691 [Trichonephila inaurata madagascariensis]